MHQTLNITKGKTKIHNLKRARPTGLAQNIGKTKHITKHTQQLKRNQDRNTTKHKIPLIITYTPLPIQKPSITIIDYTTEYKKLSTTAYHNTNPQSPQTPYKQ